MDKKFNSTIDFTLYDGTTVKMTLFFYALYQLKSKNRALYNEYNEIMKKMSKDSAEELDTILLLYVAYVCANMDEENLMTKEEFIMQCGGDREAVGKAAKELTSPKKQ